MRNVAVGRGRTVRVGPWRGDPHVASIATYTDQPIDDAAVATVVRRLRADGYHRAITAALTPKEVEAFAGNGFEPLRELVLLRRALDGPLPSAAVRVRRWRRRRLDEVLAVDRAAFEQFWRFDETALREALDATPQRILRVAGGYPPAGYALSGVARRRAYLQRLAVHPDAAGRGLGTSLLLDALRWMRWRGADEAFVNTQHDNVQALRLYERQGFSAQPDGLLIMDRDLVDPEARAAFEPPVPVH